MAKRVTTLIQRLKKNIQLPEMKILPGQLAFFFILYHNSTIVNNFYFILTLIPIIALVLVIASDLHISTDFLNMLAETQFPDAIVAIVKAVSNSNGAHANFIIFFVSALILASNGTHSMIIASNQIYKIKNKGAIYDRVKAIFMLVVLIFLLIFIMIVPVFGNFIFKTISVSVNNSTFSNYLYTIYQILNLPISWFFIFFSIKLLYTMAPDNRIPSKNVTYGALFTSISWVVFTKLYSLYINIFGNYTTLYGSISSLIVLMWWIYFLSFLFVMGMALNVSKYELKEE